MSVFGGLPRNWRRLGWRDLSQDTSRFAKLILHNTNLGFAWEERR